MGQRTPITISIDTGALVKLRDKAAEMSVRKGENLGYGDLIRDAVSGIIGEPTCKPGDADDLAPDPDLALVREDREFWTDAEIEEINRSPHGSMMANCIKENNYTWYTDLYTKLVNLWLRERSVACKIMRDGKHRDDLVAVVYRDSGAVAHTVRRRDGVPESIMEAEQVILSSHQIGFYPTYRGMEKQPWFMLDGMCKSVVAYQREVDSILFRTLEAASREDQTVSIPEKFTNSALLGGMLAAVKNVAQHNLIPSNVVMHSGVYIDLHSQNRHSIGAPPLKDAMESRDYGSFEGIPITVSLRCPSDRVFVTAKKDLGIHSSVAPPKVVHHPQPAKGRDGFVCIGEHRLIVVADYAISMIKAG